MRKNISVGLVLCLIVLFTGCNNIHTDKKIENVQAVFYHEPGNTLLVNGKGAELKTITFRDAEITLFKDVPQGSTVWARVQRDGDDFNGIDERVEIHIHSVDDINGAGWNHGKFGSGTTTKIVP